MTNFETALKHVFFVEGGYSNHPKDKGGETKYGITERTFKSWKKTQDIPFAQFCDLKDIHKDGATTIYRDLYWNKIRGDELPRGVSLMVFDSAVHAGPGRAIRLLQKAVGTKPDGILGPKTLMATNRRPIKRDFVYDTSVVRAIAHFRLLLARGNETFEKGWFSRIVYILAASVEEIVAPQKYVQVETPVYVEAPSNIT